MAKKGSRKDRHGNQKEDCRIYFTSRRRVKNARKKVEKWTRNLPEEKRNRIRKAQPVGRKREARYE